VIPEITGQRHMPLKRRKSEMKHVAHKWTMQDVPPQESRLAVVTGATSGIGFYTARELARKRATVIMPAGDTGKGKEAA